MEIRSSNIRSLEKVNIVFKMFSTVLLALKTDTARLVVPCL